MKQFNQLLGEADFNMYAPNEFGYDNGAIIKQGVKLFIQEIHFLLDTDKGDILASDYGSIARKEIWKQNANEQRVKALLTSEISQYCDMANEYRFSLDIKFMEGENRDIALIDIHIDPNTSPTQYGDIVSFRYVFS